MAWLALLGGSFWLVLGFMDPTIRAFCPWSGLKSTAATLFASNHTSPQSEFPQPSFVCRCTTEQRDAHYVVEQGESAQQHDQEDDGQNTRPAGTRAPRYSASHRHDHLSFRIVFARDAKPICYGHKEVCESVSPPEGLSS